MVTSRVLKRKGKKKKQMEKQPVTQAAGHAVQVVLLPLR